ncbi:MAG: hypothetical protein WC424_03055 [Bacilli bacterium]
MDNKTKQKVSLRDIIIIIFIVAVTVLIITFINKMFEAREPDTEVINEEIINVRSFILHWYQEFDEEEVASVSRNELSFDSGKYSLTFAVNRLRAVFPDEKAIFIVFNHVEYLEFYQNDGEILCVISYINSGRYTFNVE